MLDPDNYEQFLREAEERIDGADKEMKRRADATLKTIADNYRKLLSERMVHELDMVDEAKAMGNFAAANHHKVLAQVYRSMLEEQPVARQDM